MTLLDLDDDRERRRVSRFELARYRAGELSAERRQEIEGLLETDAALRAELDELALEERAFRAAVPFERFLADHERRAGESPGLFARLLSLRLVLGGGLATAVAAAALLLVVAPRDPEPGLREKGGGERIGFFVKGEEGARWGSDGERLRPGDRIQFAVLAPEGSRAMVIVGVDGRGEVSTYAAAPIAQGQEKGQQEDGLRLLETSLVLDDAVGPERFFVIYGAEGLEAVRARAEEAARSLAASGASLERAERLPLDEGLSQSSVHIVKVPR